MLDRRDFIRSLGTAGVAALWPSVVIAALRGKPRLAFQVYGIRDLCARDFRAALKAAAALGFEGVETGRFYGLDGEGLKNACDEAGLKIVALQLYPSALAGDELRRTIALCHNCGADRVNVAWYKGSGENINDWMLMVNVINFAAKVCASEGIKIGYHNHDQEFNIRFEGRRVCDWLFERFSPQVYQEFDPGWCVLAGEDPVAWLKAHPRRNPTVHIMPSIDGATEGVGKEFPLKPGECGVGSKQDRASWREILPALIADGTEWLVVKPTAYPDSIDDLAASIRYLKDIMKERKQ